ncbi:MAG: hypothetical protein SVW57_11735 [Thermodesulfobacteriota bacterium]|nr:hypothetical protein [Thermodesulfobacteriota bacterium]
MKREEIRRIILKIHKENQILWNKWIKAVKNPDELPALYRYREGFDQAILTLAKELKVPLQEDSSPKELEKRVISNIIDLKPLKIQKGQQPLCPNCKTYLIKKGKKIWFCSFCNTRSIIDE